MKLFSPKNFFLVVGGAVESPESRRRDNVTVKVNTYIGTREGECQYLVYTQFIERFSGTRVGFFVVKQITEKQKMSAECKKIRNFVLKT